MTIAFDDSINQVKPIYIQSNYLWFFTMTYSMVIVFANWYDARLISLFGLVTDAGTLLFPLTFLLSDLITEVYGYKYARRAIWNGFLFSALFVAYGQLIIHLPSPDFPSQNSLFDTLLTINVRIVVASALSYLSSEPLNSRILAKLKIKLHGQHMGLRFIASTIVASGMDSIIFSVIAFAGMMSHENMLKFIATMWLIKILIELVGLPVSLNLAKKLKQIEKIDIYDNHTNFNLFHFDVRYEAVNNEYQSCEK